LICDAHQQGDPILSFRLFSIGFERLQKQVKILPALKCFNNVAVCFSTPRHIFQLGHGLQAISYSLHPVECFDYRSKVFRCSALLRVDGFGIEPNFPSEEALCHQDRPNELQ
jgi:hypothetical protein